GRRHTRFKCDWSSDVCSSDLSATPRLSTPQQAIARGGKGQLVWKMDPKTDHDWAGAIACCGVDNRGVALWGNLVISHTLDGRLRSEERRVGREWRVRGWRAPD